MIAVYSTVASLAGYNFSHTYIITPILSHYDSTRIIVGAHAIVV